jgi:hypothetical protein
MPDSPAKTIRVQAILCALILPLCALLIHPVAESGINDDFSYTRSALVAAQTGHLTYFGWAAAMVGWQIYLGALFIKIFGFSFTAVRASTLLVAMATAFLAQRTFVRAGLREWNASIATLALMLAPLTMALSFSFMTDVGGLFCVILCLYSCLRSLQAATLRACIAWIVFAALSNAVGGTVRQVAWVGTIVMVPSTLWLLRRRRAVVVAGLAAWVASGFLILGCTYWFKVQPYAQPNAGLFGHVDLHILAKFIVYVARAGLDLPIHLLPITLMFLPAFPRRNRTAVAAVLLSAVVFSAGFFALHHHNHRAKIMLAPYLPNTVGIHGLDDGLFLQGVRPVLLEPPARLVLSVIVIASILAVVGCLASRRRRLAPPTPSPSSLTWHDLGTVLGPFTLAYCALMAPRAAFGGLFDRYLLVLMAILLLVLTRYYQERIRPDLPMAAMALVALLGLVSVAALHDVFAMYRARVALIAEMRDAGIPATAIDGGFEYNGWTQIDTLPCSPQLWVYFPTIVPRYSLSFDPAACEGPSRFAPVVYTEWLGPRHVAIYAVKVDPALASER